MKKQTWKQAITGLGLAVALSAPVLGLAGDFGHGHRHGDKGPMVHKRFERMAEALALTDEQKARIRTGREEAHKERRELAGRERDLHRQIRVALDDNADQKKLDALAQQLGVLKVQQMQQRRDNREQFFAILTDEQKAELAEIREKRMEKRRQHLKDRLERLEERGSRKLQS
ncbi:Spy/CpxP family protein refolding chaperone [Microbulbifer litoralis]|uniref:Spy/CpxP family protein refolding chaperone n=1 Tax=Microbulbifer litoralis TaxID=2933965 RepID=UPI0020291048|nr:Spy/CpxP family protein refolding chaperone [Microbulbifer sp. GX H0434]